MWAENFAIKLLLRSKIPILQVSAYLNKLLYKLKAYV